MTKRSSSPSVLAIRTQCECLTCFLHSSQMTSAVCEVQGRMEFSNNDGREVGEGALHLRSYAQLRLFPGSQLEFAQNIGR